MRHFLGNWNNRHRNDTSAYSPMGRRYDVTGSCRQKLARRVSGARVGKIIKQPGDDGRRGWQRPSGLS